MTEDKAELVYILAASHSGSTLLAMLLGAHPDVCTVGELKLSAAAMGDIETYLCSCGQRVLDCGFWRRVGDELRKQGLVFDIRDARMDFRQGTGAYADRLSRPLLRGPLLESLRDAALACSRTWRKRYAEIQRNNVAFAETVLGILGQRVIVDSSKVALRLKYLLRNAALNIKVIRLIRDGRAVALTYMHPARFAAAKEAALQERHEAAGLSMAEAAWAWRRSNEEAERLLARMNGLPTIDVRYKTLCRDRGATLARLFRFVGVDPALTVGDFRSVEHHVIGNDMRLDQTSEVRLDERWRDVLTPRNLRTFDRIAGSLNRQYGYE